MGFGTFDGIHPGHRFFLKELKELGDRMIVIVARDRNVKMLKGKLPRHNEQERVESVKAMGLADHVELGHEWDFFDCLKKHRPDVIGLGYDQKADTEAIQKQFPEIEIVRLKALKPEEYKSSLLKRK